MNLNPSRLALVVAGLTAGALLAGCGFNIDIDSGDDGPTVTEAYDVESFDHLELNSAWDVVLEIGPEPTLEVEVSEDFLDDVAVDQDGDRLSLSMDRSGWFSDWRGTRLARITVPSLRKLTVEGAVEVEMDAMTSEQFEVDLRGASTVNLGQLDLDHLVLKVEGASSDEADGTITSAEIAAAGASSVDFGGVTIDEVEVDGAGASSLDLEGAASVSGRLAGASSISVDDDASTSIKTAGASSVD